MAQGTAFGPMDGVDGVDGVDTTGTLRGGAASGGFVDSGRGFVDGSQRESLDRAAAFGVRRFPAEAPVTDCRERRHGDPGSHGHPRGP